jgi:hypothetical protein
MGCKLCTKDILSPATDWQQSPALSPPLSGALILHPSSKVWQYSFLRYWPKNKKVLALHILNPILIGLSV